MELLTSIVESGAARIVVEVQHTLRASKIIQQIIFYRDLPQVDFKTRIDWQEPGNAEKGVPNLKIAFTANLPEARSLVRNAFCRDQATLRWARGACPAVG